MTDDVKKTLKNLDIPLPSAEAKERASKVAMAAFEAHHKESEKNRQGMADSDRPISEPHTPWAQLKGRITMKKAYICAGSLAAAAAVFCVTAIDYSAIMPVPPSGEAGQPQPNMPVAEAQKKPEPAKDSRSDQEVAQPLTAAGQASVPQAPSADAAPKEIDGNRRPMEEMKKADAPAKPKMAASVAPMPAAPPMVAGSQPERSRMMAKMAGGTAANVMADRAYAPMPLPEPQYYVEQGRDKFESVDVNPVKRVGEDPVSTFSIDVDTSSYSFVRRQLNAGVLPPKDAVRVEEMVNYFNYSYPVPAAKDEPFKPSVTVYTAPWNAEHKLVHIGIQGHEVQGAKPHSNLVFLIDVSGSMNAQDRLPLVKNSLRMLLDELQPDDTVGIVTYAGAAGTALEPTKVSQKAKIIEALERLGAGGSTAGAEGIRSAYALAEANFDKKSVNRVILATDGDFNVGISDPKELQTYIEGKRDSGVYLSVLGFGQGNYNDALMQKLAQNGNGNAAYIDNLNEARKVLVQEASSTLFTIAKDVKIQVEFNPATVSEYRLIGYETRALKREDFNNDKVDAGEVGAGHAVTAIYEITPVGKAGSVDALRYSKEAPKPAADKGNFNGEYAFLKIRYKLPSESESKLLTTPINSSQEVSDISKAADDVRFATAVAAFGQMLKGDPHTGKFTYDDVLKLAEGARGKDTFGYRVEFTNLVRLAKSAQGAQPQNGGSLIIE